MQKIGILLQLSRLQGQKPLIHSFIMNIDYFSILLLTFIPKSVKLFLIK